KECEKQTTTLNEQRRQLAVTETSGVAARERVKHLGEKRLHTLSELPAEWRDAVDRVGLSEQLSWKTEHDRLAAANTEQRAAQLEKSRAVQDKLREDKERFEREQEGFPPDVRLPLPRIKLLFAEAQKNTKNRTEDLQTAQRERDKIEIQRSECERL